MNVDRKRAKYVSGQSSYADLRVRRLGPQAASGFCDRPHWHRLRDRETIRDPTLAMIDDVPGIDLLGVRGCLVNPPNAG